MRCADFQKRWQAALDERQPADADPQLAAHLRRCDGCRELVAAFETLLDGFEARSIPEPADDFALRVVAKCAPNAVEGAAPLIAHAVASVVAGEVDAGPMVESRPAGFTSHRWVAASLAAAAALLVALGWQVFGNAVGNIVQKGVVQKGDELNAVEPLAPPAMDHPADSSPLVHPAAAHPAAAHLADSVEAKRTPAITLSVAPLPGELPSELDGKLEGVLDGEYLSAIRQTGWAMATLPGTVRRVAQGDQLHPVTETIRPFTNSMSAVLDAIRRTLPGKADDSKS